MSITEFKQAVSRFPSGVTVVAAEVDGEKVGLTVSSFASLSLEPPMVLACIDSRSASLAKLLHATEVGISILSEHQADYARRFASKIEDRFESVSHHQRGGAVLLDDAAAWLTGSISSAITDGDHTILTFRVTDFAANDNVRPLFYVQGQLLSIA
ncbi:flavin reductase family protein [Corynebacterium hindlerae]|uniref:Flavin reductase family protein n=1 Tax=Corynebacterium hindlerae TaxID=699041 RepID=A0A7G5FHC3_9CORY|nr:flavin reductase family protein [Corynebacterium hindlerae]QMV86014.1 flavin reductase family protein [Corynebacterium hindlerae]